MRGDSRDRKVAAWHSALLVRSSQPISTLIKKANGGRVQAAERSSTSALVAHRELFELHRAQQPSKIQTDTL